MCLECKKENNGQVDRRSFLAGAGAAVIGVAAGEKAIGQQVSKKALDDPKISHKTITFKNGRENIAGVLAQPKAAGHYRAVIVTHGNAGLPEDIRNTAAQLAQAGFVALAVDPTSRYPDMSKFPREILKTSEFGVVMMKDIQAGIEYLDTLSFVKAGGIGLVGFCGGGIIAILMSALVRRIGATVAFYAAPFVNPENNTLSDPRPHMLSFVQWVTVPIQAHFGTNDAYIPTNDAKLFEREVAAHNPQGEVYFYEGAAHGFANYTNDTYLPAASVSAENRMLKFFKQHLK